MDLYVFQVGPKNSGGSHLSRVRLILIASDVIWFIIRRKDRPYLRDSIFQMFQVTFSEQALRELSKLETRDQMQLIEPISNLTAVELAHPKEPLGRFHRDEKTFFRLRAGDFRVYFEIQGNDTIYCEYILHKNTLTDFVFRTKLPVSEEQLLEQHQSFWKYLESLKK